MTNNHFVARGHDAAGAALSGNTVVHGSLHSSILEENME